jgi:hypothetical protein
MVQPLLTAGINPALEDYKGNKAMDYAVAAGSVDYVKELLKLAYPDNPLSRTILNATQFNAERKQSQQINKLRTK